MEPVSLTTIILTVAAGIAGWAAQRFGIPNPFAKPGPKPPVAPPAPDASVPPASPSVSPAVLALFQLLAPLLESILSRLQFSQEMQAEQVRNAVAEQLLADLVQKPKP